MAKKTARPGRTLIAFFVGLAIAYGLVALNGSWKPELGLDLQGGTRIILIAEGSPSKDNLDEAKNIIDDRVNGSGVAEAQVTTSGGNTIQVEIPGSQRRDLVASVEKQAQLRFRLVACDGTATCTAGASPDTSTPIPPTASSGPSATGTPVPSSLGTNTPTATGTPKGAPTSQATKAPATPSNAPTTPASTATSANRAPSYLHAAGKPKAAPTTPAAPKTKTPQPSATPGAGGATSSAAPSSPASSAPVTPTPSSATTTSAAQQAEAEANIDQSYVQNPQDGLAFQTSPTADAVAEYNKYQCNAKGELVTVVGKKVQLANVVDDPTKPLVACGTVANGNATQKFLLSEAMIEGTDVNDASAGIPNNQTSYAVSIDLNGHGAGIQAKLSSALQGNTAKTFAIVLDGQVISSPYYEGVVSSTSQITGTFDLDSAQALATSLKYGALPIAFKKDVSVETIGPSLAGDQLHAGLLAGGLGLILVMLYCLLYYRGLGLVVLSSLIVAAGITYAMVLLLSKGADFTLTLPGIAGLIISIGITADSFIILFERIRDEMRDGKSMRVAVEAGWQRARNTTLAADGVSLLAAVVLYIFAAGVVKGFAFALGLTTLIDLLVFFYFTKPLVSYLALYKFFNRGHRMSGLSRETLGTQPRTAVPAGGKA